MRVKTPHHYARLLTAQKLLKARNEAELANLKRDLIILEEENNLLAAMMEQGSHADFVDPLLISQRMERNRRTQARLALTIRAHIQIWLQYNRRVERLAEKQAQAQAIEARAEQAKSLGETFSHSFIAQSNT